MVTILVPIISTAVWFSVLWFTFSFYKRFFRTLAFAKVVQSWGSKLGQMAEQDRKHFLLAVMSLRMGFDVNTSHHSDRDYFAELEKTQALLQTEKQFQKYVMKNYRWINNNKSWDVELLKREFQACFDKRREISEMVIQRQRSELMVRKAE